MRFDGKTNPQRAVSLNLTKLSNVGSPAHQPALARIIKSQDQTEVAKLLFNDALDNIQMRQDLRDILIHFRNLDRAIENAIMETLNDEEVPDKKAAVFTSLMQFITALQELVDSDLFEGTETVIAMQKQKDEEEDEERRRRRNRRRRRAMRKAALNLVCKLSTGEHKECSALIKDKEITRESMLKATKSWEDLHKQIIEDFFKTGKQEEDNVSKELETKLEKMEAQLVKTTIYATFNDNQKDLFTKMSKEEQEAVYKEEDPTAREALFKAKETEMKKAAGDSETYTASTGETIVKSEVGDTAFAMLKAQDMKLVATEKRLAKEEEARKDAEYKKRASELWPHLKGTDEEKGRMLKEIEALPEETRAYQMETMKSANESAGMLFKESGHGHAEALEGEDRLDALAKSIMEQDKTLTYEKAYVKAMKSPEGDRIYKQMDDSRYAN